MITIKALSTGLCVINQNKADTNTHHKALLKFISRLLPHSLAEELLSEALAEVAEEFESIMGEYAEAVFTSEFLSPARSPPASVTQ